MIAVLLQFSEPNERRYIKPEMRGDKQKSEIESAGICVSNE